MALEAAIYSGGIGINNKADPVRLAYDIETGVTALETAMDVLIDGYGAIVTRKGSERLLTGPYHSLWPTPTGFYAVSDRDTDSALYNVFVNADGSLNPVGVWSGLIKGQKFDYFNLDSEVYYTNGSQRGRLLDGARLAWPINEWPGEVTTDTKVIPPVFEHMDILSGVVVGSVGNEIFATAYGLPGILDTTDDRRRMEGKVIMIASVQTGAYISTNRAIYFLSGTNPQTWSINKVRDYPAVEWGRHPELVDPTFLGVEIRNLCALFATARGPAIGTPDGSIINLNDKVVSLPPNCRVATGSIMVVDETTIIQSGE